MSTKKEGQYEIEVSCGNCGYYGTEVIERGISIAESECNACGCFTLEKVTAREVKGIKSDFMEDAE